MAATAAQVKELREKTNPVIIFLIRIQEKKTAQTSY